MMRAMIKDQDGCTEVVLINKASLATAGNRLVLTRSDRHEWIYVDINNWTAHAVLLNLLENGYADLSDYAANYKKL